MEKKHKKQANIKNQHGKNQKVRQSINQRSETKSSNLGSVHTQCTMFSERTDEKFSENLMDAFEDIFKLRYIPVDPVPNKKPIKRALKTELKQIKKRYKSPSNTNFALKKNQNYTSASKKSDKKLLVSHSKEYASSQKKKITTKQKKNSQYNSRPINSTRNYYEEMLQPFQNNSFKHLPLILEQQQLPLKVTKKTSRGHKKSSSKKKTISKQPKFHQQSSLMKL